MLVGNGRARKQRKGKKLESIYFRYEILRGFSGDTSGKEPAFQYRRQKRHGFNPWVGKIPWRRAWQPTLVFLPGDSPRSLAGYSPRGHKESDMTEVT